MMTNFYTGIEVGKPPPPVEGIPGYLKSLEAENVALRDKVAKLEAWRQSCLSLAQEVVKARENVALLGVFAFSPVTVHVQKLIDQDKKEKSNE